MASFESFFNGKCACYYTTKNRTADCHGGHCFNNITRRKLGHNYILRKNKQVVNSIVGNF